MMANTPLKGQTHSDTSWQALQYLNLYRFIIALLFVSLIWIGQLPQPLGIYDPYLFLVSSHIYIVAAIFFGVLIQSKYLRYNLQVAGEVLFDICILSSLMYASAGLSSGFGMLLVIAVAGGSILSTRKIAVLFAAVASLLVLGQEIYSALLFYIPNYTHAGFLGITFFAAAILGHALASRVQKSEALARQRAVDLKNLARLNEYIVQGMQSGIVVLDDSHRVRLVNESAKQLLGLDTNVMNKVIDDIVPQLAKYMHLWLTEQDEQTVIFNPEHGDIDVQASFTQLNPDAKLGILIFLEDVAQLRQRAQHMKLASLGRLAASIAHEVRNPLGAISHAGQLLSESHSLNKEDDHLLQIILQHTHRVNSIIENTMQISRRESAIVESINIKTWLETFANEFDKHHQLEPGSIVYTVEEDDMNIRMDPGQLHQVIWNLSENAIRYSKDMPLLEFRCSIKKETDRPYLDVIDHGSGIPDEIMDQIE